MGLWVTNEMGRRNGGYGFVEWVPFVNQDIGKFPLRSTGGKLGWSVTVYKRDGHPRKFDPPTCAVGRHSSDSDTFPITPPTPLPVHPCLLRITAMPIFLCNVVQSSRCLTPSPLSRLPAFSATALRLFTHRWRTSPCSNSKG